MNFQSSRTKGEEGEERAVQYLEQNGFSILARNYSPKTNFQGGEIDVIAKRGSRIHFIEVKFRRTDAYGAGRESVGAAKQKSIRRLASMWLVKNKLYGVAPISFDVIEITAQKIEYLENCF